MTTLSTNASAVPYSGIREIAHLAMLKKPGDVIRLETGEPSAPTPTHIVEAAVSAARGRTGYTHSAGLQTLREIAGRRVARVTGLEVDTHSVVIGQGAVQLLSSVLAALVSPGDEVLVPDPSWPNYVMQATLYGARVVPYRMRPENDFLPDLAEIESLIGPRTKVVIVNSPSNPTGQVMDRAMSEQLVAIAVRRGVFVLSDEVYDEIVFDGDHVSLAPMAPDSVASIFSLSKTYSMTGWRIGYSALPVWLADTVAKLQEALVSSLPIATQAAAVAALTGPQVSVADNLVSYRARRDAAVATLRAGGLEAHVPHGAFYLMVPLARGVDSRLAALDLVEHGVSMAPGKAFGAQTASFLRVSLASDETELVTGIERYLAWHRATDGGLAVASAV